MGFVTLEKSEKEDLQKRRGSSMIEDESREAIEKALNNMYKSQLTLIHPRLKAAMLILERASRR
jgi:hypothetical protein